MTTKILSKHQSMIYCIAFDLLKNLSFYLHAGHHSTLESFAENVLDLYETLRGHDPVFRVKE